MYDHPLAVSNAVLRINTNIIKIHRNMKDVALSLVMDNVQKASRIVDKCEVEIYKDFGIIDKRFLEMKNYDVITSNSGEDAIEKVKSEKPDAMLLNIRMPGMEGTEVLKRIREFDKNIVIIMVTAVKEEQVGKEALKAGADEYITKPIDFNYLEITLLVDLIMRKK